MTSDHATHPPHTHPHLPPQTVTHVHSHPNTPGVLAWSAWRRLLVVLPVLVALWLAVAWAHGGLAL